MGGEWGIGAALTMESLPARLRGVASGVLQQGYAAGYLLAALAYWLLFDTIGWRGMFALGVLPALLALYGACTCASRRRGRRARRAAGAAA